MTYEDWLFSLVPEDIRNMSAGVQQDLIALHAHYDALGRLADAPYGCRVRLTEAEKAQIDSFQEDTIRQVTYSVVT